MKLKYLYITVIGLFFLQQAHGQRFTFTVDTAYLNELSTFVNKSKRPELQPTYTEFAAAWSGGQLSQRQKTAIVQVSNNLLKKRARVFPHFYNYMKFVLSVLNSPSQSTQFDAWHRVFDVYTTGKTYNTGEINRMLVNLTNLNDTSFFFQSRAVLWKHNASNYRLEFDVNEDVKVFFSKTDLICESKRDSSYIYGTKGYYYPLQDLWVGEGGTVTWQRAGFSKDSVNAKLNNYRINLKRPEYRADTVEFIHKLYLSEKMLGRLEEKILANARGAKASYPRFMSYDKQVDIKDVVPGVDYSGGFVIQGSRFFGYGDAESKAKLFFAKDEQPFITATSSTFIFDKEYIRGNNVFAKFKIEEDSIWHPGLNFNYSILDKRIVLTRAGTGLYRSKFYNTYHDLDTDAEQIVYDVGDSLVYFTPKTGSTYRKMIFESGNYFSPEEYKKLQMMDRRNPLEAVKGLAFSEEADFTAQELANYLGKSESSCINLLLRLSDQGYLYYDTETRRAYPKEKLYKHISANYGNEDYDAIKIVSNPVKARDQLAGKSKNLHKKESNAILNLNTNVLSIYGVGPFPISRSKRVGVIPENSPLLLGNKFSEAIPKNTTVLINGKWQRLFNRKKDLPVGAIWEDILYKDSAIFISEGRREEVFSDSSVIRVKKGLEIEFDGMLQAGLASLYGKDLNFNYDSFYINLPKIDSVILFYKSEEKNQDSLYEYAQVTSTVDSVIGLLRIDKPYNKSGTDTSYREYPIFESHKNSYVFYDQRSKLDTVYKKEDFYFENFPFEIDSLNEVTRKNIRMNGIFKSGGVFPDFEEDLIVQPDSSLGFVHELGDGKGMDVYGGLGIYHNTITLNNSGLKGDGRVEFLNTKLYSEQFDFFPDSMNTYANRIEMEKQDTDSLSAKYPAAYSDSVYVHWEPQRDQMFITSLSEPLNLFADKAKFDGTLRLKPKDLGGKGTLTFLDANLKSDSYTFYDESFEADTADFKLQPEPGAPSPFLTYNVSADVDFEKKHGMFKSNGDNSYIEFPVNQFKCYMNYFSWKMGINQIDIGTQQGLSTDSLTADALVDSTGVQNSTASLYDVELTDTIYTPEEIAERSRYISTNAEQDSLSFYALTSSYDINNFIIKAKGVKFITIADAHIFPASEIIIARNADIRPFDNARIVANRTTRYHKFFDASVKLLGSKNYTASADYEYIDKLDSMQIIHFNQIGVDKNYETIAEGRIEEKSYFTLAPQFSYFGKIGILAQQEHINFEGYTKINHFCDKRMPSYWLEFNSAIDPDSIVIPLAKQPKDNELRKLQASMYVTNDSLGVYTSFLTTKRRFSDKSVLDAKGYLFYNDTTGYFEICDSAKLVDRQLDGNYLSFHKKLCLVLGEGKMDLGVKLGQVEVSPVGKISQNLDAWKTQMEVMLGVDFFFSEPALKEMANTLNESYSLAPVDFMAKDYQLPFKELLGSKRAKQLSNDFSLLGGFANVPAEMNKTLFFSNVKLKWDNYHRAWVSDGKIGIGNLKNTQVNKYVDGFIEVKKSRGGDIINIYLEINPNTWFFFTYTRGTLKTISSSDDYNDHVINLKDKERRSPDKEAMADFAFYPATERAKDNFVNEMRKRLTEGDKDVNIDLDKYTSKKKQVSEEVETELEEEEEFLSEEEEEDPSNIYIETEEIEEEGNEEKPENKIIETEEVTNEPKKETKKQSTKAEETGEEEEEVEYYEEEEEEE